MVDSAAAERSGHGFYVLNTHQYYLRNGLVMDANDTFWDRFKPERIIWCHSPKISDFINASIKASVITAHHERFWQRNIIFNLKIRG